MITANVVLLSDDNFFTNPKRSEQLCDLIIKNKIKKIFIAQTRIDVAGHPRGLDKAEKAGFKMFPIGIESPHDRILKQLQKGITEQKVPDAFAILTQYDFYLHGYFIYGNIGETEEEMLDPETWFGMTKRLEPNRHVRLNLSSPSFSMVCCQPLLPHLRTPTCFRNVLRT